MRDKVMPVDQAVGLIQSGDTISISCSSGLNFSFFQGAGFDIGFLSFLEVDSQGSVNVSRLRQRPHVTSGVGGFIDITYHASRLVFSGYFTAGGLKVEARDGRLAILQDGKHSKFVPEVEHLTFNGKHARRRARDITYVTERGVFKLREEGVKLVEIAPGVDLKRDILDRAGFPMLVDPDLREMDPRLFRPEPLGLRLGPQRERRRGN